MARYSWIWKDPDPETGEKGVVMQLRISCHATWRENVKDFARVKRFYNIILGEHLEVQNPKYDLSLEDFYAKHIEDLDLWFYATNASREFVIRRSNGKAANVQNMLMPATCYLIDQSFWRPEPTEKRFDFICCCNDLIDYKRPELALEFFLRWNQLHPESSFILVFANKFGDTFARCSSLARRAKREGARVEFLRNPTATTIRSLYNASRFLLHPSSTESSPRVIGEALACGIPCILPTEAWIESVAHLSSGWLAMPTDEWRDGSRFDKVDELGQRKIDLPALVNTRGYLEAIDTKLSELNPIWTRGQLQPPQFIGGHRAGSKASDNLFLSLTGAALR